MIILITGTSTGIGRAAVERLRGKATVIATARNLDDIRDLEGYGVEIFPLDVADEASRKAAVDHVLKTHGRIDVLVNNAGYGAFLPVEETSLDQMQAMYDVNVFGLHRLTQLVLPGMRAQGSGRIVNVASIVGHISFPFSGTYSSTKFAVRSLTMALDSEVRSHGIRAILVEPGRIKTRFSHRGHDESAFPPGSAYEAQGRRFTKRFFHHGGAKPEVIARYIAKASLARRPKIRYLGPMDARGIRFLVWLLPDSWIRAFARLVVGRPKKAG
ncbi:MAG: SDR family NAD(P)-dependent oxidoreductase [Thermoplasmatota archaeon]